MEQQTEIPDIADLRVGRLIEKMDDEGSVTIKFPHELKNGDLVMVRVKLSYGEED